VIRLFNRTALLALLAAFLCNAVPLDNWRFPYYQAGVGLGYSGSSKSGMFWDDLGAPPCFGMDLWPDTSRLRGNYWTLEPAIAFNAQKDQTFFMDTTAPVAHYVNDKNQAQRSQEKGSYSGGQALSDVRYRNILIRQVLDVDSRNKDDLDYRGKTDRFAAGRIAEAYCQVDWKHVFFRFGRLNRNWGPFPDRSLLLSSNPHSYDALEFSLASTLFEFRYLFAAFPYGNSSVDAEGTNTNRYLSVHSLNFMLGRLGEIGFFESLLFSRNGGLPDLQIVNPFSLYSVINTNGEGTGNLLLGAQWNIHPFIQNMSFKGQVLIDDIQVDNKTPMDQEPTHWGVDLGAYYSDFLPMKKRHFLSLEYRYLSRWLYTVNPLDSRDGQRYSFLGRSLGAETNDNDRVNLSFFIADKNYWAGTCGVSLNRQGENSLWSNWKNFSKDSLIAPDVLGYRTESKFPSGIVEKTIDFYVSLMGYYKNFADVSLKLNNRWIKNKNNVSTGSYEYDPLVALSVSFHYSNFVLPLPE
jgi:hypothetical protein